MNRELLITIGGLLVVGLVVVATFLYGNQQRQAQLRTPQTNQHQQQAAKPAPKPTPSPTATTPGRGSTPAQQPTPASTPATGSSPLPAIAATVLLVMAWAYRRSRRSLRQASIRT